MSQPGNLGLVYHVNPMAFTKLCEMVARKASLRSASGSLIALNAIERRPEVVSSIQNGESNGGIRKLIPWNARAVF